MGATARKPAAGTVAAAVAGAALLGGPALALGLDAGQATGTLTTGSTAQPVAPGSAPASTSAGNTANSQVRTRTSTTRTSHRQSAPVSASVQGSNPHGQGTTLSVSLGGNEAVVVGRSRGERGADGSYHGHTTTLGLFGNDVIANDTGPGQTAKGPLAPPQEQLLDHFCKGSSGNVCVDLLRADSATTGTGSTNHSRLVGLMLGGANGANAVVGDSNGDIQSNGDCEQAHGDVTLVKLMLGGNPLLDIGESASDSNSCPSGTTVRNSSNPLVAVGGQAVPLPGCGANAPGNLVDLSPLVTIACNAGAGTGAGGIVNDALAGTAVSGPSGPVATVSGAGTGAAAQAAPSQTVAGVRQTGTSTPTTNSNSTKRHSGGGSANEGTGSSPSTPASATATRPLSAAQADKLPYTGSNVVLALFVASCLLAAGLGLRRLTTARAEPN